MENTLNTGVEKLKKGLFDQKGGTLGMVLLAIGVIFFIVKIPVIIAFVDSLFHLAITLIALAFIIWVLTDKKIRNVVGLVYIIGIQKLIMFFIKIDPVSILEDTIKKMYRKIANVEDKMGKLNGIRLDLKTKIKKKKTELKDCLDRLTIAQRDGKQDEMVLEDRQSVRLKNLTQEYIDLSSSTEIWYNALDKIAKEAKVTVQDAENEVSAQKERYELVKTEHNAFKSAMSILEGDPDQLANYNMAYQAINDDIMVKIGEMDRVINSTGGVIDKIDMNKEVYAIKSNELSKKYQELGIDALFTKFEELPSKKASKVLLPTPVEDATIISSTPSKTKYF
jgi:hypothetical protein